MKIDFQLDVDDFKATQMQIWKEISTSRGVKTKLLLFNVIVWIPLGIALAGYFQYFQKNLEDYIQLSIIAISFLLWFILFICWHVFRKRVHTNAILSADTAYCRPQTWETVENGFVIDSSLFTSKVKLSAIQNVVTDQQRVFVVVGPATIFTIPTSAFKNLEEQQIFVDTLRNNPLK